MTKEKAEKFQRGIVYPKVKLKDVFWAFWRGIKPRKWQLFVLMASVILANISLIIVPVFYKQFFDIIYTSSNKAAIAPQLVIIVFYVLFLNVLNWIFFRIATFVNSDFEPMTIANLKQQAYNRLMGHSYSFFVNNFAGSLVQKVNRFARAFERITGEVVWNILPLIARVITILAVIFFINRWIDLVLFIWIIIFIFFNVAFSKWKLQYDIKAGEIDSKATGYLSDTITNQGNIQLFNGFSFESKGYKAVTDEQAKVNKTAQNLDSIMEGGQAFLGVVIEFILFYYTIKYWQQGLVTVGVFVLLQAYILTIVNNLWGFTRIVRDFYQGYADSKEMVEIMLLDNEIKDNPLAKELLVDEGKIEFKDLGFSFNKKREVLKNINLIINPGEKIALIGPSGAGKTTFVRLLLRLYSVTLGKILIDNQDISEVTQESLRKNISMVPQDPLLFHRTLSENIAYGKRDATKKEIERAAKLAHCEEFIKDLPHGYETFVGERGIKLSGGERQRVAIARAILKNAPILILDEATSSLDSNSEMLIQDALNNLMEGKTVIVIAHRLSTIQKMDRIVVVEGGKIIEQGSHQELLEKDSSLYKKLWELQAGGFLKDNKDEEVDEEDLIDEEENESEPIITKMVSFH